KKKHSLAGEESPVPSPSVSQRKKRTTGAEAPPMASPTISPRRKKKASPTPSPTESPSPTPAPSGSSHRKKKASPSPTESESPSPTPSESPSSAPAKKQHAPNATLLPNQIKGFENYPLKVQKLLTAALELTTRNLDYKYGSGESARGRNAFCGCRFFV